MKNNKKVTTTIVTNYSPSDDAVADVTISGNVIEIKVLEHFSSNLSNSKRISKDYYVDTRTGEVKEYHHNKGNSNSIRNMNKAFEKLRLLINTNFTCAINELHVTLTYADKMDDFDIASKDFKRFWEKLHYKYPDLEFIRVIEPQHTGTWHIHVLIKSAKFEYLTLPKDELEKLWGHGYVWITKIKDNDNIGAYFTTYHKDVDVLEKNTPEPSDRKCIVKGARLKFYPPNKRFYSYSKGIKKPVRIRTTYGEAKKMVNLNDLVYEITNKITVTNTKTGREVATNHVMRLQLNSKRKKKS